MHYLLAACSLALASTLGAAASPHELSPATLPAPVELAGFDVATVSLVGKPEHLVAGRFDQAPGTDLAVLSLIVDYGPPYSASQFLTTLAAEGSGFRRAVRRLTVGGYGEVSMDAADVDLDGDDDLGFSPSVPPSYADVLLCNGDLTYTAAGTAPSPGGAQMKLQFEFVDDDPYPDTLMAVNEGDWYLDSGLGQGNGYFFGSTFAILSGQPGWGLHYAVEDLNGTGSRTTILLAGGGVSHHEWPDEGQDQTLIHPAQACTFFQVAELDGAPGLDIIALERSLDRMFVLTNDGSGDFALAGTYDVGRRPHRLVLSDLDLDGDLDVAVSCSRDDTIELFSNDGAAGLSLGGRVEVGDGPRDLVAGDFNADGRPDLATACSGEGTLRVLFGKAPN